MRCRTIAIIAGAYLGMAVLTYTGMCADDDWWGFNVVPRNQWEARKSMAANAVMALFPPCWLTAVMITGFYQHGFRWNVRPAHISVDKSP